MVVQAAVTPVHNDDNNAGPDHAGEEKLLDAEESLAMRKLLVSFKIWVRRANYLLYQSRTVFGIKCLISFIRLELCMEQSFAIITPCTEAVYKLPSLYHWTGCYLWCSEVHGTLIHLRSYSKRHASNVVKLVIEWLIALHSHGRSLVMCAATSVMRPMNVHRHVIFTHHK